MITSITSLSVTRQSASSSSATQHAICQKLVGARGTECLNTKFPLNTLINIRYIVKLKTTNYLSTNPQIQFKQFDNYCIAL